MSSHSGTWNKTVFTYGIILLGSGILSFGLYNIHERTNVTEGGVLGMTLLLQHWFGFSPSVTSPLMDIACYLLAWRFLGNAFARYALAASLAFAGFHALWEQFPPLLPDLSAYPAIAAVAGALFVGLGVGLVVRIGGACGGAFASFFALKAYAMGGPSFLNFAMFIGDNPSNVWLVMAAFAISFIVSAVLTVVFGFDENR